MSKATNGDLTSFTIDTSSMADSLPNQGGPSAEESKQKVTEQLDLSSLSPEQGRVLGEAFCFIIERGRQNRAKNKIDDQKIVDQSN